MAQQTRTPRTGRRPLPPELKVKLDFRVAVAESTHEERVQILSLTPTERKEALLRAAQEKQQKENEL